MQDFHPWLPLVRNIVNSDFFKHPDSLGLFLLLFSMANRSETVTEDQPVMVGQLRINYSFLRDYYNASTQNIRTRMARLKKANAIYVDGSHRHYMLITIRHYNEAIFAAAANKGGWVKFYNEVTNYSWFRESDIVAVYVDILCKCYSTDSKDGNNISITGIVKDTGISRLKVMAAILRLQKEGVVNFGTRKGSDIIEISFINGGLSLPAPPSPPSLPVQHTTNTPLTHHQHTNNTPNEVVDSTVTSDINDYETITYGDSQHTTNTPSTHQVGVNKPKTSVKTVTKQAAYYLRDRDIDKYINNNNNNNTCARARKLLLADKSWMATAMTLLGIKDLKNLLASIDRFFQIVEGNGFIHKNLSEYKRHFLAWYPKEQKKLQSERVQQSAEQQSETSGWVFKPLTKAEQEQKDARERLRLQRFVELSKDKNCPSASSCIAELTDKYYDGTLKRLGIDWKPINL